MASVIRWEYNGPPCVRAEYFRDMAVSLTPLASRSVICLLMNEYDYNCFISLIWNEWIMRWFIPRAQVKPLLFADIYFRMQQIFLYSFQYF